MFCCFNQNNCILYSNANSFIENIRLNSTTILASLVALLAISLLVSGILGVCEIGVFSAVGNSWSITMMVGGGLAGCLSLVIKCLSEEILSYDQANKYDDFLKPRDFFYFFDSVQGKKMVRVYLPDNELKISDFPYPYNDMTVDDELIFKCNPEFQHVTLRELKSRENRGLLTTE